ncbi:MAG: hypothetical protein ACK59Y_05365 [Betaproteobacteria bacterium]|jgi:hypothetical protein
MDPTEWVEVSAESNSGRRAADALQLPHWDTARWRKLLSCTKPRPFRATEIVIQRGTGDRTLQLVAAGSLEVSVTLVDGVSMTSLARIGAGSVLGE